MSPAYIALCVFIAIIILLCCALVIVKKYKEAVSEYEELVTLTSERLINQKKLNETINFTDNIEPQYRVTKYCNSKRKLDNLNMDLCFIEEINLNLEWYKNLVANVSDNATKYNSYINRINSLQSAASDEICKSLGTNLKKYIKYEDKLFNKNILTPVTHTSVLVEATYTSPQGRKFYKRELTYDLQLIKTMLQRAQDITKNKQTRQRRIQEERAKMTDSMRYNILRRDNFRCQICGSTASDGVKLHVDHIIPVSKGGKTIESNLRTLCDRCNLGKSDKLE